MAINNFTYNNLTSTGLTLSWIWDISTLNVGDFTLRRGNSDILLTGINPRNSILNYTDSNLNPGTNYTYYLFNSNYTFEINVTTHDVPSAISNAYISYVTADSARLEWFAPDGYDITGYNILLDDVLIDNTDRLYNELTNLLPNTNYKISIQPVNIYGSGTASVLNLTTLLAKPAPLDPDNINFNDNTLTWLDTQNDVRYIVQRREQNSQYREIYRGSLTQYSEPEPLNSNAEYQYRIKVYNTVGSSAWSYGDPILTPDRTLINNITINSSVLNQNIIVSVTSELEPNYYEYRVSANSGISWILDWSVVTGNTIILNGLDENLIYWIEVQAINEFGTGDINYITVNLNQVSPSVPFGLTYSINLAPSYQIVFTWSEQIAWYDNSAERRLYAYDLVVGDQHLFGTTATNSYVYDFTSGQFNDAIEFKVKAINDNGITSLEYSDTLSLTLPDSPSVTVVPVTIAATRISFNISTIYNDAAFGDDSSEHNTTLEYKLATVDTWSDPIIVTGFIEISDLKHNSTYDFRFKATNALTESNYETLSLTTPEAIALTAVTRLAPAAVADLSYDYREVYFILIQFSSVVNATRYVISILDNENNELIKQETASTSAILRRPNFNFTSNSYRVTVRSFNDDLPGGTTELALVPDTTVPSQPTGVVGSVFNSTLLRLTWTNATDADFYSNLLKIYVNNKESTAFIPDYSSSTTYYFAINSLAEFSWPGDIQVINYSVQSVDHFGNTSESVLGSINYDQFTINPLRAFNISAITDANSLEYSWEYLKYSRTASVYLSGIASERTESVPRYIPLQSIFFRVGRAGNDYGFKDNNALYQAQTINNKPLLGINSETLMLYSGSYYGSANGVLPEILLDGNYSLQNREIDEISWNIVNRKLILRTHGNVKWAARSVLLNYWGQLVSGDEILYQFNFGGLDHTGWINLTDGASFWSVSNIELELNKYINQDLVLYIYNNKPDTQPGSLTTGRVFYAGLKPNNEYTLTVTSYNSDDNSTAVSRSAITIPRPYGVRRAINGILRFVPYYNENPNYIYNLSARQLGDVDYHIFDFNDMLVDTVYEIKCEEININGSVTYSYYRLDPDNNLVPIAVSGNLTNLHFIRTMDYSVTYEWTEYERSKGYLALLTNPDDSEILYELDVNEPFITYYPEHGETYSVLMQVKDEYDNLTRPYYDDYIVPYSPGTLNNINATLTDNSVINLEWDKPINTIHYQTLLELYRNNILIQTEYLNSDVTSYEFNNLVSGNYTVTLRSLNSIGYYTTTYSERIIVA